MVRQCRFSAIPLIVLAIGICTNPGYTQSSKTQVAVSASNATQMSEKDVAAMQDQLLQLVRLSPTLAEVVARDPSLLSDAEYVSHNNPQLAHFLQAHPEVAQNPDFYLFNNLHSRNEAPAETLERQLWPQLVASQVPNVESELISTGAPFLVFVFLLGAVLWLVHVLLENRRWSKIFKLQTDVHSKLIERFGTSQEVLTYMGTDAGKQFLEATPIAVGFEPQHAVPSPVARVLTPLQIGIVMSLLGIGLLALRHSVEGGSAPLLVAGTIVLMPGLGFIISAGITWVLARRLGLMPENRLQG